MNPEDLRRTRKWSLVAAAVFVIIEVLFFVFQPHGCTGGGTSRGSTGGWGGPNVGSGWFAPCHAGLILIFGYGPIVLFLVSVGVAPWAQDGLRRS